MTCLLQTPDGDIDLTGGKQTLVTDPVQAGAIKLRNRLLLFKGEWFRDTRVGLPYFEQILVKNPNIALLENIFRQAIVSTPPFVSATVKVTLDAKRKATVAFVAKVDPAVSAGATVTATSLDKPFILNLPAGAS